MAFVGNKMGRRVLIIVQNLPVPFDRRVWLEATSLTKAGYRVSVICPKAKGFNETFETLEGVDIHRYALPFEAQGALGFILEFAWCFLRTAMKSVRVAALGPGFDVIHACNPPETFWLLARFWRLFGKRFLFDHHDLSPEMYAAKFNRAEGAMYRGLLFLERMSFRTADVVITTNESHKRIAVARGGMDPSQVLVVRSGPDVERFKVYEPDPDWKSGKQHLLVYLGEMCKQDGVDHLVRVAKLLRDEHGRTDFHVAFVGGGPEQPLIRQYAEDEGVGDLCTFTGRVSDEDLCRILSSADLAVDPDPKSDWSDKSTMNKIMEYMFFGLPIVAYDLTEHKVSAQAAARYAEPNSEIAMAGEINDLLERPEERAEMADYGRKRVRDKLVWQHSEPPLLAAYDQLFQRQKVLGKSAANKKDKEITIH